MASRLRKERNALTLEQRVSVVKKLQSGQSCRSIAQELGCGRTQISKVSIDREKIMALWESGDGRADQKWISKKATDYEELNDAVFQWFSTKRANHFAISC